MFNQLSKQILLGILVALLLMTMQVNAVEKFKTSNYGAGHQIWFEAEAYDERNPEGDEYYALVDKAGAFGQAINRTGSSGGMIRWTFDISKADGKGGTWYFWARLINPNNQSDYMLVEGDPGDPEIPTGPPFPGNDGTPPFVNDDDRIFEENVGTEPDNWAWGLSNHEEGHTKELQNGVNTMYIFDRSGNRTVFWDVFMWTDDPDYEPTDADYEKATVPIPGKATQPNPPDGATDVTRDVVLSWTPGEFAAQTNGHKVYFSESFNDVNDGIGGITQSSSVYTVPQRLDFSTTYYWRVDEVDGPPDFTVHKGNIWRFTTENVSYEVENVSVTASSSLQSKGPENTVNGSGLDSSGLLHGNVGDNNMWLSDMAGPQPTWIEFEFDTVCKLHEMWVWNSNESLELMVGLGFKDVTIEYSLDGIEYTTLGTTYEFAQGTGTADYAHNTTVDLTGVTAKYIRLTANSNWGGFLPQFGLSEVRFFDIPVSARGPSPASGTTDVELDLILGWKAGREAAKHDVYLSSDEQAVIDGNVPLATVTETSYGPLSLDLAQTYYWRVDEVNDAETPATWEGGIWDFSTKEFLVVDDFEDYNEFEPFTVYNTWTDGYQDTTNGSTIGYVLGNPQETINVHGGKQSVPVMYDNSVASFSEVAVNPDALAIGRDWTTGGAKTLSVWFSGAASNTAAQMYVKINSSKVAYDGDASNLTVAAWQPWNIDLTSFGAGLQNVTKLAIGIDGIGAAGTLLFDDIRLYPYERQFITPVEPNNVGLVGHYKLDQDATDSSGNNNHGTLGGDPKWTTGKIGGALDFDGDDYVDLGNPSQLDFGTGSWSVSAWIKMPATTDNRNIFSNGGDNTGGIRYMLNVSESEDHKACLTVDDDATKVQSTSSVTVDDDQWHHIIGIRDGSSLLLYVDGALDGTNTLSAGYDLSGTSQANAYIGTGWRYDTSALNKFFIGVIDDVRIYGRVLTEEEIVWLAGRTKPFDKPF